MRFPRGLPETLNRTAKTPRSLENPFNLDVLAVRLPWTRSPLGALVVILPYLPKSWLDI
jgi:hypothetical protein